MKKLYYVSEVELDFVDEFDASTTGNKTVTVYEIVDNELKLFTVIECLFSDNSEKEIQYYLDDNGFGDDEIKLVAL